MKTISGFFEKRRRKRIDRAIPGYSRSIHWDFFKTWPSRFRNILVCGVYLGRDLAYLVHHYDRAGVTDYQITGVDLFADTPGTDWPDEKKGLSWEAAGFGTPPSEAAVRRNLASLGLSGSVRLVTGNAIEFLRQTDEEYDVIYIAVAHDFETTDQLIELGFRKLTSGGTVCGDDFSDAGTWGVEKAVKSRFEKYEVIGNRIWMGIERKSQLH